MEKPKDEEHIINTSFLETIRKLVMRTYPLLKLEIIPSLFETVVF